MKRLRRIVVALAVVVLAAVVVVAVLVGPFMFRLRHFTADAPSGYHADFYLYVSAAAERGARSGHPATLLIQPNNSGRATDDVAFHRRDAWWTTYGRHGVADELSVVLLVPAFVRPGADWTIYTHALDRDALTTTRPELARVDLQLLHMVDRARAALRARGIDTRERLLIQGFSASGMFANRFAALHPDRVLAVAAGSPGGWPIAPVTHVSGEPLPYPAGVADLTVLTGAPFDSAAYVAVPQLIVMGDRDDNDSVDYRDGWDEAPAAQVDRLFGKDPRSRWDDAESLYRSVGADVRFLLVPGVGHERKTLQIHTTRFFASVLSRSP